MSYATFMKALAETITNTVESADRRVLTVLAGSAENTAKASTFLKVMARAEDATDVDLIEQVARGIPDIRDALRVLRAQDASPALIRKLERRFFDEDVINGKLASGVPPEKIFPSEVDIRNPDRTKRIKVETQIDRHVKKDGTVIETELPYSLEGRTSRPENPRSSAISRQQLKSTERVKDAKIRADSDYYGDSDSVPDEPPDWIANITGKRAAELKKSAMRIWKGLKTWHGSHLFAHSLGFDWPNQFNFIPALGRVNLSSMGNIEKYVRYIRDLNPARHVHMRVQVYGPWKRIDGIPVMPSRVEYRVYHFERNAAGKLVAVKELPIPQSFFDPSYYLWMSEMALTRAFKFDA